MEVIRLKSQDLVLKVVANPDKSKFDISKYEPFLDLLCSEREYQKEAIRNSCNYLFGGSYPNLRSLARENYDTNRSLQEKYQSFDTMEKSLPFPDQLACSVDLATGTGKSYVIYGIARIGLASGLVDRVLVLCPSVTIEMGLTEKFNALSERPDLSDVLPADSRYKNPVVLNATDTATGGTICVENIHVTYGGSSSSVQNSYAGKGDKVLVLNDEAHHIYSPDQQALKKWRNFLIAPEYGFRYVVGFSGTCYIGDEYFTDVVSRYSLLQAMQDRVVKLIDYAVEDGVIDQQERWQMIYKNHADAKVRYTRVKPLTIIVAKDIATCKRVTDELVKFLSAKEGIEIADAAKKVLRVHTRRSSQQASREDKEIPLNLSRLRAGEPDRAESPIEWITSVSMLTEGWDVKNVFQIVPHEERAFNSKLLIAQVLGRGLRIPEQYRLEQPVVRVFNHDSWSGNIRHLVSEVMEDDREIRSLTVNKAKNYDFDLHHIDYSKAESVVRYDTGSDYSLDAEYLPLSTQRATIERKSVYERTLEGTRTTSTATINLKMYTVDEVVVDIHNRFRAIDLERKSDYAERFSKDRIRRLVRASLDKLGYAGDEVSRENKQRILSEIGEERERDEESLRYERTPNGVFIIRASERRPEAIGSARLWRGATLFYDDDSKGHDPSLAPTIKELEDPDFPIPRTAGYKIAQPSLNKTCLSAIITNQEPERKFVRRLVEPENADKIMAWIKNRDSDFYEIEYSYLRGHYPKRGYFNPDFFLCLGKDILVVEIKGDEERNDPSPENKGKYKDAKKHFDLLNTLQGIQRYHFCFLTPSDYDLFFGDLRNGNVMQFQSALDADLLHQNSEDDAQNEQ